MSLNRGLAFLLAALGAAAAMTAAFNLPWMGWRTWSWDVVPILAAEVLATFLVTIGVAALPWLVTESVAWRSGRAAGIVRLAAALLVALAGNALVVLFARSLGEGDPDRIGIAQAWWRFLPVTMTGGAMGGLIYVLLGGRAR